VPTTVKRENGGGGTRTAKSTAASHCRPGLAYSRRSTEPVGIHYSRSSQKTVPAMNRLGFGEPQVFLRVADETLRRGDRSWHPRQTNTAPRRENAKSAPARRAILLSSNSWSTLRKSGTPSPPTKKNTAPGPFSWRTPGFERHWPRGLVHPHQLEQQRRAHTLIGPTVTNPCGKLASLRSRPFAPPHCPPSSGGSSERDGRRASPFGFGRRRGSPPSGRANRPALHIASLPSSLPACLSIHPAPCACGLIEHGYGRCGLTVK